VTLAAGGSSVYSDGPALQAGFNDMTGATIDSAGNIYMSDSYGVRRLSPQGYVTTVAGTGSPGYRDGPGQAAQFNGVYPWWFSVVSHMGICQDSKGDLYVADVANNCIRKIAFNTVARPPLQIVQSNNAVTLTWPSWASDFILESSGGASVTDSWLPTTNGTVSLQNGVITWSNGVAPRNTFYRLRRP